MSATATHHGIRPGAPRRRPVTTQAAPISSVSKQQWPAEVEVTLIVDEQ